MRTAQSIRLPVASHEYAAPEQQVMRRSFEQVLQDLRNDIESVRDKIDSASSLSMRRHQFLLMGMGRAENDSVEIKAAPASITVSTNPATITATVNTPYSFGDYGAGKYGGID